MTQKELLKVIADAAERRSKELDLSSKGLTSLPPEIGNLTNLTELDLANNQLTVLPPEIGNLTNLTLLHLYNNQLTVLPPEIGKLTKLTGLYLGGNQFTVLPPEIGNLTNLTELRLYNNQFTALPPEIGKLTNLTELDLADNQFTVLPPEIGNLTKLTVLYLGDNQLTVLPPEIGNLTKLTSLDLEDNQLTAPPPEVAKQGTRAILEYLRARLKKGRRQWVSKLIVIGEGEVGKTAMLRSLKGLPFDPNLPTTHGITIEQLKFKHPTKPDTTMQLNAWDFGGQEIYHATHQFFLTNQSLFVLVWNARMGWEQSKLYYWLDAIKARAPDSPVILVATRAEEHQPVLPLADIRGKYPKVACPCAISNATGAGIEELQKAIAEHAASLPRMGEEWPADWLSAAEEIRTRPERRTTPQELDRIMARHSVEPSAWTTLATTLHELGDILFFKDDEELKDFVILKPEWVSDYVCKVLDDTDVKERDGILTRELRDRLWPDLDEPVREHFLRMMEKFDLSYRTLENREISLVVERLQLDPPKGWSELWDQPKQAECCREVTMRYRFPSDLPPGVPTWFIARSHRFTMHKHWRNGAVFADDAKNWRHLALVSASPQARTLELSVRGPMPHNFLALLRDGLELTLRRYPGLVVERYIPCPGHNGPDRKPCAHEFKYPDLEARLMRKQPRERIECPVGLEDVSVPEMVFGLSWPTTEGVVLERIGRLEKRMDAGFDKGDLAHEAMQGKLDELIQLSQRQFLVLFTALQKDVDVCCPNVFTLKSKGALKALIGQTCELQLYCQARCWHPTSVEYTDKRTTARPGLGRYEFKVEPEWIQAVTPYVRGLSKVLKYAAPAAGGVIAITNPQFASQISTEIMLMIELARQLPEPEDSMDARIVKTVGAREEADRLGGAALRAIRKLLDEKDPTQHWGGLRRILTPEGHYLWLCEHHAKEYKK
jgi:GTPase SAR1 family protein